VTPNSANPNRFELCWVGATLDDPPVAPRVIVDGFVRRGELAGIGAPRGIGKSWVGFNLAALVGRGGGYLFGTLQVVRPERVLFFHGETPPWMAAQRWQMLQGTGSLRPEVADVFDRWRIRLVKTTRMFSLPDGPSRRSEETVEARMDERMRRAVEESGAGLVIIDPWATFYAGQENSNDETEAAVEQLRILAEDTGAAVVIIHHVGKGQDVRDAEDLWRGASRLADALSTRVTLLPRFTPQEAEKRRLSPGEARRHVSVRFLRRERATEGFNAVLGDDGWWSRTDFSPADGRGGNQPSVEEVVTALRVDGGEWPTLRAVIEALGCSPLAAGQALRRAKDAGFIRETEGPGGARRFVLEGCGEVGE
jgi:hypothetical protein